MKKNELIYTFSVFSFFPFFPLFRKVFINKDKIYTQSFFAEKEEKKEKEEKGDIVPLSEMSAKKHSLYNLLTHRNTL